MLVVVKRFDLRGSIAIDVEKIRPIASFVQSLDTRYKGKSMQVIVLQGHEAYGEYAPYTFLEDKWEFVHKADEIADYTGEENRIQFKSVSI
jgi:hypothetical protein